ncbi:S41 family peptidase [Candidatus Fermentibacteria bacterium]|nr:S41 family peptidase [Candidatus Fermentibacteria bacterium]
MNRVRHVLAAAVGLAVCAAAVGVNATGSSNVYRDLELLGQSLSIVRDAYVDPVDVSVLVDYALRSMVESLDQHSTYLDSEDLEAVRQEAEGTFGGVGVVVASRGGFITVVAPLEGSPSAEAGLRPADVIVEIDGQTTQALPLRRAVALMRGSPGSWVELTLRRKGFSDDLVLRIQRRMITIPTVPYSFTLRGPDNRRYGYVRLASFTTTAVEQSRDALQRSVKEGCAGIILDLRANPGGLLDKAVGVADLLFAEGVPICYTIGRQGSQRTDHASVTPGIDSLPVVALVEEGTASGSEIVAGALQENRRGIVVGRPTFGKGTVQEIRELGDGNAVKITTARWFTPHGYCIDRELGGVDTTRLAPTTPPRVGVVPNILVEEPTPAFLEAELADALPVAWMDSVARVVHPPRGPTELQVDDSLLRTAGTWLAHNSPLAASNPDSAAALASALRDGHPAARQFFGAELARRWWPDSGASKYLAATDTLVHVALAFLADPVRYEAALDLRADVRPDTLAHLAYDESE